MGDPNPLIWAEVYGQWQRPYGLDRVLTIRPKYKKMRQKEQKGYSSIGKTNKA